MQSQPIEEKEIVEKNEIDESDEEIYEEIEVIEDKEDIDIDEDLDTSMKKLEQQKKDKQILEKKDKDVPIVEKQPEVADDFIRNFLVKAGLVKTLEAFQKEWYDKKKQDKPGEIKTVAPDIALHNRELQQELQAKEHDLKKAHTIATWEKLRKERDYHKLQYNRVSQEKAKLMQDVKLLKKHVEKYQPTIFQLQKKYENAMKDKMITRLERDKIIKAIQQTEEKIQQLSSLNTEKERSKRIKKKSENDSAWIEKDEFLQNYYTHA